MPVDTASCCLLLWAVCMLPTCGGFAPSWRLCAARALRTYFGTTSATSRAQNIISWIPVDTEPGWLLRRGGVSAPRLRGLRAEWRLCMDAGLPPVLARHKERTKGLCIPFVLKPSKFSVLIVFFFFLSILSRFQKMV